MHVTILGAFYTKVTSAVNDGSMRNSATTHMDFNNEEKEKNYLHLYPYHDLSQTVMALIYIAVSTKNS